MSEEKIIYLDNAATTFPKPEVVYQAMDSFYRQYGGNAGRGANPLARKATSLLEETRELVADWLGIPTIVFSPSSTIALNTVIFGAGLRVGDIVYVTPFEHNSVLRPIEHLRKTVGIEVRVIPFDKTSFECDLNQTAEMFRIEPPTMLCVSQISNVFGNVLPIDQLVVAARAANENTVCLVDGTQAAGLLPLQMRNINALVFSGHKSLYGPFGVAGIGFGGSWRPQPLIYGGTGTQSERIDMPSDGNSRYEAGSHNIAAIAGLNSAVRWLNETGREAIVNHIAELTIVLQKNLSSRPRITTYLPTERATQQGVVSFNINGISPQAVEAVLGARAIAVRAGLHCAPWAHKTLNTVANGGTTRLSVGWFNTLAELSLFADELDQLIDEIAKDKHSFAM